MAPKNRPVPESLAAVVRKAMLLDRDHRYPCVADLQRDICAYQNGFATGAENPGIARQLTLLVKRHKAVFTTAAAAQLLIIGLAVWFVANVTHARNRAESALEALRRSAPAYHAQARAFIDEQRFDEALEKIATAIALQRGTPIFTFSAPTLCKQGSGCPKRSPATSALLAATTGQCGRAGPALKSATGC